MTSSAPRTARRIGTLLLLGGLLLQSGPGRAAADEPRSYRPAAVEREFTPAERLTAWQRHGLVEAPRRVTAATAAEPADVELGPVTALRPRLRLDGRAVDHALVEAVDAVDGVAHVTALTIGPLEVLGEDGSNNVTTVAAVDPVGFRVLTPPVSAESVDLWRRLLEGDAAFTHDVGHRLGLELGERVDAGEASVRVGAFASNGVPPIADAIVSSDTAAGLGVDGEPLLLVALADGADERAVAGELERRTGLRAELLPEPPERRAFLSGAATQEAFEPFTYVDNGDGTIVIDPDWVARNIVSERMPVFRGHVTCHRMMMPQLRGALQEVVDRGLDHLIDLGDYGGCWVPRHIDWSPSKPLSMHAWGLAIDFNVSTNQLGAQPQMDRRIVEVFERWGFVWGGHWRRPDGMHFELGVLLEPSGG